MKKKPIRVKNREKLIITSHPSIRQMSLFVQSRLEIEDFMTAVWENKSSALDVLVEVIHSRDIKSIEALSLLWKCSSQLDSYPVMQILMQGIGLSSESFAKAGTTKPWLPATVR